MLLNKRQIDGTEFKNCIYLRIKVIIAAISMSVKAFTFCKIITLFLYPAFDFMINISPFHFVHIFVLHVFLGKNLQILFRKTILLCRHI